MPIEFPPNLVFYLKPAHQGKKIQDVKIALRDKAVLEQAAKWFDHYADFANQSKRLRKIQACVIEARNLKDEEANNSRPNKDSASHIQQAVKESDSALVTATIKIELCSAPCNKRFMNPFIVEWPNKKQALIKNEVCLGIEQGGISYLKNLDVDTFLDHFPTVMHYFQMRALSGAELISIVKQKSQQFSELESQLSDKQKSQLNYPSDGVFLDFISQFIAPDDENSIHSILENLTEDQLFDFFSLVDHEGMTLFCDNPESGMTEEPEQCFPPLYPYLERLSPEHIEEILVKSRYEENIYADFLSILADKHFDCALRVFGKLTAEQGLNVLSRHGLTSAGLIEMAYLYKESLTSSKVKELFFAEHDIDRFGEYTYYILKKDESGRVEHLHDLLGMLTTEDLVEFLALQNHVQDTVLHDVRSWPVLLKLLENLNNEQLQYLFGLKNSGSHTPLSTFYYWKNKRLKHDSAESAAEQINVEQIDQANFKEILLQGLRKHIQETILTPFWLYLETKT